MKWVEPMPPYKDDGKMTTIFIFSHVIPSFGVPQAIITDHGSHFQNFMMIELTTRIGLFHDSSTPYYLQENGQVEAVNKVLTIVIKYIVKIHK